MRGSKGRVQVVAEDQIEDLEKVVVEEDVASAEKTEVTAARAARKLPTIIAAKRAISNRIARRRSRQVESAAKWGISKP